MGLAVGGCVFEQDGGRAHGLVFSCSALLHRIASLGSAGEYADMASTAHNKRARRSGWSGLIGAGSLGLMILAGSAMMTGCMSRERTLVSSRAAGDEAYRLGDYDMAAGYYEKYLEERPGRREVMYDLGRAYEGMGEMSAAREAFTLAYELDPFNPKYIDAMARSVAANGEIGRAFDILEQIAMESAKSDAYARLGGFLLEYGFPDESVLAYTIAAKIDPSAASYLDLAKIYGVFEDKDGELDALSRAMWFDSDSAAIKSRVRELGGVPGPTFAKPSKP